MDINLDLSKETYPTLKCKQNDDLTLCINLYNNGSKHDIEDSTVILNVLRSNNTFVKQTGNIIISKNSMLISCMRDITRVTGLTKMELVMTSKNGKQRTTFNIKLNVIPCVITDNAEASKNVIGVIEELDNKIAQGAVIVKEVDNKKNEAIDTVNKLKTDTIMAVTELEDITIKQLDITKKDVQILKQNTILELNNIKDTSNKEFNKIKENTLTDINKAIEELSKYNVKEVNDKIDKHISDKRIHLTKPKDTIYGVKIDITNSNPETAVTYMDDAIGFTPARGNDGNFNYGSWKDKFPFNKIKPCLFKDGKVNYYLNSEDFSKKIDGSNSDITSGNDGDVMVEFPKIYWRFERTGNNIYIRYSDIQVDDEYKCLAHLRGDIEKDYCYISAYLGYELNNKLRSLSNKTPIGDKTTGEFRIQAQANGSGYEQMAYYQLLMLQVLYIVMFKDRDSQTALGRGFVDGNTGCAVTGNTNTKGLFWGETTGKQQVKFCGIEDFYGNLCYWIDGLFCDKNRNLLMGNKDFNELGNGYTSYGQIANDDVYGYIKDIQGTTETGFIVKDTAGSASTYFCDYGGASTSYRSNTDPYSAYFGRYYRQFGGNVTKAGAFNLDMSEYEISESTEEVSARLMFL